MPPRVIPSLFSSLRSLRSPTHKLKILRTLNILTFLTFVSSSVYSIVLAKPSSIDICDKYPTYFTPSLTFIGVFWSILFFLQFCFVSSVQFNDFNFIQSIVEKYVDWLFSFSNLFMCGWLFFWLRENFIISEFFIVLTLLSTSLVQNLLTSKYIPNHPLIPTSVISFIHIPFSMFSAFSCFLLFHNGFILLSQQGYEDYGKNVNLAIISASLLTIYSIFWCTTGVFSKGKRDLTFSFAIVWILIGIAVQQKETSLLSNACYLLALIQIMVIFFILLKNCLGPSKTRAESGESDERAPLFRQRMNFYGGIIVDNWYKAPINDDHPGEV
ncbi:hypothetical protein RhiirC2_855386 [Rhizophagus irregularis]|uniref:Uncharacterized protein n=1 Tax=Rhizophagus irregularis TaxID=588596 RepID=A0A2N1MMM3_9GLOM|nr:hypothetical protein RhiirC2_855386 [Rhizophagus irregularis]